MAVAMEWLGSNRSGDQQYMFDKARSSFILHTLAVDSYFEEAKKLASSYRFITNEDLINFNCKDCTSAARWVLPKNDIELGKTVNYACRELTQIPVELTVSPHIETLHLGFNNLTTLNKKLFRMPLLSILNLDQNMLYDIPKEFRQFSSLTTLSLKNNRIETIHPDFCTLSNLTELSISNNLLKELPHGWGKLANLKRFWVSENQIETLPVDCAVTLSDFDLKTGLRRQIFSKGFGGLESLEELWFDNNRLKSITSEIRTCTSLRYLNFRRNCLDILPSELGDISSLEYLVLTHNSIKNIPDEILTLPNLHTLSIACNRLQYFPTTITSATSLTDLDISHNPLGCLPAELCLCKQLIHLNTTNCVQAGNALCPSSHWSRTYAFTEGMPIIQKDGITISWNDTRPRTSSNRLFGKESRGLLPTNPAPLRGRPLVKAEFVQPAGGGPLVPSSAGWPAPGGILLSKVDAAYSPPPLFARPPATPYSSSRPNTCNRYSGAYHEAANI